MRVFQSRCRPHNRKQGYLVPPLGPKTPTSGCGRAVASILSRMEAVREDSSVSDSDEATVERDRIPSPMVLQRPKETERTVDDAFLETAETLGLGEDFSAVLGFQEKAHSITTLDDVVLETAARGGSFTEPIPPPPGSTEGEDTWNNISLENCVKPEEPTPQTSVGIPLDFERKETSSPLAGFGFAANAPPGLSEVAIDNNERHTDHTDNGKANIPLFEQGVSAPPQALYAFDAQALPTPHTDGAVEYPSLSGLASEFATEVFTAGGLMGTALAPPLTPVETPLDFGTREEIYSAVVDYVNQEITNSVHVGCRSGSGEIQYEPSTVDPSLLTLPEMQPYQPDDEVKEHFVSSDIYTLVEAYRQKLYMLQSTEMKISALDQERADYEKLSWKMEVAELNRENHCRDGVRFTEVMSFEKAIFDEEAMPDLKEKLAKIREECATELTLRSYQCALARMEVESFIDEHVSKVDFSTVDATDAAPGMISRENARGRLRHYLDVLFYFERVTKNETIVAADIAEACDLTFCRSVREWITYCAAVVRRIGALEDHAHIFWHLMQSEGVAEWASRLVCFGSEWNDQWSVHMLQLLGMIVQPLTTESSRAKHNEGVDCVSMPSVLDEWVLVKAPRDTPYVSSEEDLLCLIQRFPFQLLFTHIFRTDDYCSWDAVVLTFSLVRSIVHHVNIGLSTISGNSGFKKMLCQVVSQMLHRCSHYKQIMSNDDRFTSYQHDCIQGYFDFTMRECCGVFLNCDEAKSFLPDLPYDTISTHVVWQIFLIFYKSLTDTSGVDEIAVMNPSEWLSFVEANDVFRKNFAMSLVQKRSEYFVVSALASLAFGEKHLAVVIAHEMFYLAYVSESRTVECHRSIRELLTSVCDAYPPLVSILLHLVNDHFDMIREASSTLFRNLPLSKWKPSSADFKILETWLLTSLHRPECAAAQVVFDGLFWGAEQQGNKQTPLEALSNTGQLDVDAPTNQLFLGKIFHQNTALLFAHAIIHYNNISYFSINGYRDWNLHSQFIEWCWNRVLHIQFRAGDKSCLLQPFCIDTDARTTVIKKQVSDPAIAVDPLVSYVCLQTTSVGYDVGLFKDMGKRLFMAILRGKRENAALRIMYDIAPYFMMSWKSDISMFRSMNQEERQDDNGSYFDVLEILNSVESTREKIMRRISTAKEPPADAFLEGVGSVMYHHVCSNIIADSQDSPSFVNGLSHPQTGQQMATYWLDEIFRCKDWFKDSRFRYLVNVILEAGFRANLSESIRPKLVNQHYVHLGNSLNSATGGEHRSSNAVMDSAAIEGSPEILDRKVSRGISLLVENMQRRIPGFRTSDCPTSPTHFAFEVLNLETGLESGYRHDIGAQYVRASELGPADRTTTSTLTKDADNLLIFRWAYYAANLDPEEPLLPLFWQVFFYLYFERLPNSSGVCATQSSGQYFGYLLFKEKKKLREQLVQRLEFLSQYQRKRVQACAASLKGVSSSGTRAAHMEASDYHRHEALAELYHAMVLWLKDTEGNMEPLLKRLDGKLSADHFCLMRLTPLICHSRYETGSSLEPLWSDLVLFPTYWPDTTSFQPLGQYRELSGTRTQVSRPATPLDSLAVIGYDVKLDVELSDLEIRQPQLPSLPTTLNMYIQMFDDCVRNIRKASKALSERDSTRANLDQEYLGYLPLLYRNEPTDRLVKRTCTPKNKKDSCRGAAAFLFQFVHGVRISSVDERMKDNRRKALGLMGRPTVDRDACISIMVLQRSIERLPVIMAELQSVGRDTSSFTDEGCRWFYSMLDIGEDSLVKLLKKSIETLGRECVSQKSDECAKFLTLMMKDADQIPEFSQYFNPSQSSESFVGLYEQVVAALNGRHGLLVLPLLERFDLDHWLYSACPPAEERRKLLLAVKHALRFYPKESSEEGDLARVWKVNREIFRMVYTYEFPAHYSDCLNIVVEGTRRGEVSPDHWNDLAEMDILAKVPVDHIVETCSLLRNLFDGMRSLQGKPCPVVTVLKPYLKEVLAFAEVLFHRGGTERAAVGRHAIISDKLRDVGVMWNQVCEIYEPLLKSYPKDRNVTSVVREDGLDNYPPWSDKDGAHGVLIADSFCRTVEEVLGLDMARIHSVFMFYSDSIIPNAADYVLKVIHTSLVRLPWKECVVDDALVETMFNILNDPACVSDEAPYFAAALFGQFVVFTPDPLPETYGSLLKIVLTLLLDREPVPIADSFVRFVNHARNTFSWHCMEDSTYDRIVTISMPSIVKWMDYNAWTNIRGDEAALLDMWMPSASTLNHRAALSLQLLKDVACSLKPCTASVCSCASSLKKRQVFVTRLLFGTNSILPSSSDKYSLEKAIVAIVPEIFEHVAVLSVPVCDGTAEKSVILFEHVLPVANGSEGVVAAPMLKVMDGFLQSHPKYSILMLAACCRVLVAIKTMASMVEVCIENHFASSSSWRPVIEELLVPEIDEEDFVQSCLLSGSVFTLHAYSLQLSDGMDGMKDADVREMKLLDDLLSWTKGITLQPDKEYKVLVLWILCVETLVRGRASGFVVRTDDVEALVAHILRESQPGMMSGVLSWVGLGNRPSYRIYQLSALATAAFLSSVIDQEEVMPGNSAGQGAKSERTKSLLNQLSAAREDAAFADIASELRTVQERVSTHYYSMKDIAMFASFISSFLYPSAQWVYTHD